MEPNTRKSNVQHENYIDNVIIDTDVTINNMSFHRDTVYKINFMQQGNKTLHISMVNVSFKGIYLSVESSQISMFVKENIFIRSGIQINTKFNDNHLPVVIDNCTFLGYIDYYALAFINITNLSL